MFSERLSLRKQSGKELHRVDFLPPGRRQNWNLKGLHPTFTGSNPTEEGALETSPLRGIGLFGLDLSNPSLDPLPPREEGTRKRRKMGERETDRSTD